LTDIYNPDQNFEFGATFWFKFGILPQTSKIQPYGKIGLGLDYMTLHTREQATQFNFTDQGALGMHYFFTKNTALTLEGRFRHLSNCGIKKPNRGISSYFGTAGITYQY
jgi:predicted porin